MANKTTFLKLEKPNLMSTNWGASLNNNFEKLDKNAESVNNNLQQIRNTMGENNIIGMDENYPYIHISKLNTGNKAYNYTLTLREKGNLEEGESKVIYEYENGNEKTNILDQINDYTGFYIAVDYEPPTDAAPPADMSSILGKSWSKGEIATKYTGWSANGLNSAVLFTKYKQALGGWYVPKQVKNNIITWEKQFAENAPSNTQSETIIYPLLVTSVVFSLKDKEDGYYIARANNATLANFVSLYGENPEKYYCDFYDAGSSQKVYVDYSFSKSTSFGYVFHPKTKITEDIYFRISVGIPK